MKKKIKKSKLSGNKKAQKEALQALKRFKEWIQDSKKYCDGIDYESEKNTKIKAAEAARKVEAERKAEVRRTRSCYEYKLWLFIKNESI